MIELVSGAIEEINGKHYVRFEHVSKLFSEHEHYKAEYDRFLRQFEWWREAVGEEAWSKAIPKFHEIANERDPFLRAMATISEERNKE